MNKILQQMPYVHTRKQRYTTWDIVPAKLFDPDASNPPTASSYFNDSTSTTKVSSWLFDNSTTDYVYGLWVFPKHIYLPDSIKVYLGWRPDTAWSTGDYYWTFESVYSVRNNYDQGDAVNTQLAFEQTPSNDNTREDLLGTLDTPASTDEMLSFRLLLYDVLTSGDVDAHAAWLRFEYTAWIAGEALHPGQRL